MNLHSQINNITFYVSLSKNFCINSSMMISHNDNNPNRGIILLFSFLRNVDLWTKVLTHHHHCKNNQSSSDCNTTYQQKENWKITHCWVRRETRFEMIQTWKKSLIYCQTCAKSLDMLLDFINNFHLMHCINFVLLLQRNCCVFTALLRFHSCDDEKLVSNVCS